MANEFKVKKGLIVQGSGSVGDNTILDVQGNQGQLFSITDSLSGSLFSVGDISGVPILEVFSNEIIKIGTFGSEGLIVNGSNVTASGNISASGTITANAFVGDGSGITGLSTGTVTGVTSGNGGTIVMGGTSTAPTVAAVTNAVSDGGTNLATGDQIYDHVTTRISGLTSNAGTVTGVTTGNSNTITIGGTSAAPTVAANTAAVSDNSSNLATGDQIYDHVTTRISGLTSNTGTVDTTGTIGNDEFPQFHDSNTLKALTAGEMRAALNVPNTTTVITNNNQLSNGAGYSTVTQLNASSSTLQTNIDAKLPLVGGTLSGNTFVNAQLAVNSTTVNAVNKLEVHGQARVNGTMMIGDSTISNTTNTGQLHIKNTGGAVIRLEDSDNSNLAFDLISDEGVGFIIKETIGGDSGDDIRLTIAESTGNATFSGTVTANGTTLTGATDISGKQDTITGAATTIDDADLTANRAVISNGSGKIAISDVTSTELGYLDGVTSGIQSQLDNKAGTGDVITAQQAQDISDNNNKTSNATHTGDVTGATTLTIKSGVALAGNPTTTTQTAGNDSTRIATTAFVGTAIDNLIGTAGSTLDTLGELSASLADTTSSLNSLVTTVGTKLAKASNLSDLQDAGAARTNLGLAGGSNGQFLKHDGTFGTPSYTTNTNTQLSDAEVRSAVEAATDSNVFTDADHTKLNNIEASATADQSATEIRNLLGTGNGNLVPSAGSSGQFLKHDGTFGTPSYTTNTNTQLSTEQVQDIVGAMVESNSEDGISVAYQDGDGTLDFTVASQTDNNFTTTLKNKLDGFNQGLAIDDDVQFGETTITGDVITEGDISVGNNGKIVATNTSTTYIKLNNDDGFIINTNNVEAARMFSSGVVINEGGAASMDFRVESDSNNYALFVDSGNNQVVIGGATGYGGALLSVNGDVSSSGDITAVTGSFSVLVGDTSQATSLEVDGPVTASAFVGERIFIGGASANISSTTQNKYFYGGSNGLSSNTWNVQVTDPTSIPQHYVNNLHMIPCGVTNITVRSHNRIALNSQPSIWIYTGSFGNDTNSTITMGFAVSQSLHSPADNTVDSNTHRFVINITGSNAFELTGDNDVIAVMMKNEGTAGAWRFNYRIDGITTE